MHRCYYQRKKGGMKVLFSANDAGGANAIAPVIASLAGKGAELHGALSGPAQDIFAASGIPFTAGFSASPEIFVAGTSAGDTPDKRIMRELTGTPSLYVLDFWLNYWQRFSTTGKKDFAYLPTRICVMDEIAKGEMIAEGFPPERLIVTAIRISITLPMQSSAQTKRPGEYCSFHSRSAISLACRGIRAPRTMSTRRSGTSCRRSNQCRNNSTYRYVCIRKSRTKSTQHT